MIVRSILALAISTTLLLAVCFSQTKSATEEERVFRAPFKLKLHVDDERYYEQSFDRIPYVSGNDVYLFVGEAFGINVTATENEISHIAYERNPAKADVELRFTQEKSAGGPGFDLAGITHTGGCPVLRALCEGRESEMLAQLAFSP
jgi:hypothetical protein